MAGASSQWHTSPFISGYAWLQPPPSHHCRASVSLTPLHPRVPPTRSHSGDLYHIHQTAKSNLKHI